MEFVFVIPRAALFPECAPHGLALFGSLSEGKAPGGGGAWDPTTFETVVKTEGFFVEREYAERTPSLKQVIPYTLVVKKGDVLLLQRTKGGGESRLHGKYSLGVGGHVNPVDAMESEPGAPSGEWRRILDPLPAATRREVMEEELTVTGATRLTPVGILNDDTNPVGAVHVGLVQVLELLDGDAQIREIDQLRGEFVTPDHLRSQAEEGANFETWSNLLIPQLDHLLSLSAEGVSAPGEGAPRDGATARNETDSSETQVSEKPRIVSTHS